MVAAITISADSRQLPDERHQEWSGLEVAAGRRLSERLGYRPATNSLPWAIMPGALIDIDMGSGGTG